MLYNLNNRSYFSFDQYVDLSELNRIKPYVCLAFAKNYDKICASTVGNDDSWPDGSIPNVPKNIFSNLQKEINFIKNDSKNNLYRFVKNTPDTTAKLFVKLMTNAVGIGSSYMLNSYNGPIEKSYQNKHLSNCYPLTDWAKLDFKILLHWIKSQDIFAEIGRIIVFFNDEGQQCGLHRDFTKEQPDVLDQFIWINLFPDRKKFYLLDPESGTKHYINNQVVMFDSRNWHASDAHPQAAFSIRVDGTFNKKWIDKIMTSK